MNSINRKDGERADNKLMKLIAAGAVFLGLAAEAARPKNKVAEHLQSVTAAQVQKTIASTRE